MNRRKDKVVGPMMYFSLDLKCIAEAPAEEKIREQQSGLLESPDEKLVVFCIEGRAKWRKGSSMFSEFFLQSDEVYRGMAAGRILAERHGEVYVRELLSHFR